MRVLSSRNAAARLILANGEHNEGADVGHNRTAWQFMSARKTCGCTSRAACWALGASKMTAVGLDPRTPVLIGVGQVAERIEDPGYAGLSPIDLAVGAARA